MSEKQKKRMVQVGMDERDEEVLKEVKQILRTEADADALRRSMYYIRHLNKLIREGKKTVELDALFFNKE